MNPTELLALLGRYNTDPLVEAALTHYAVRNRPEIQIDETDGSIEETQSWVKNSRAGIEFGFQDEAAWIGLDVTEFGERPMVLTEIYFYGSHAGVRPYVDPFPFGLQLSDDKATVRKKLLSLEPTRRSYIRDTWNTQEFRMTVAYADGDKGLDFVICMLREPRPPQPAYAIAAPPSVDAVIGVLGRTVDDPAVHAAFDPLGLRGRMDEIRESGEADFRRPYGVSLDFVACEAAATPGTREIRLSSATFYAEREQGARTWSGELPYAIRFGDSPETAIRKIGRPPDAQSDNEDNFSGVAVWNQPNLTVTLFYDTMENQVLRVSVAASASGEVHDYLTNCLGSR